MRREFTIQLYDRPVYAHYDCPQCGTSVQGLLTWSGAIEVGGPEERAFWTAKCPECDTVVTYLDNEAYSVSGLLMLHHWLPSEPDRPQRIPYTLQRNPPGRSFIPVREGDDET